ncbi:MAG: MhpC [Deltaproteobacteria bacterium]|nr:MhpC [Deltaproteobacteria bacterium]
MPFQTINGIRIYYEEHGKGFPVLLIQGLGYPSGMWFLQIPEFSRCFRTIVFDNRGVGKTDRPDEEYTVALMASDAAELLRALGITRAHVVGVSLGGYIAQDLALTHPDLIDCLVLMSTSCGGPQYLELTKDLWQEVAALAVGDKPALRSSPSGFNRPQRGHPFGKHPALLCLQTSIRRRHEF